MKESAELVQFVSDWFSAASRGDADFVRAHVAPGAGTTLTGSDPAENFTGGDDVRTFLLGEVEGAGGAVTFTPANTQAFESGDVGYAVTRVTIVIPDGGTVTPRWTGVMERVSGQWRVVHIHASFGVANADVGWEYPNT